MNMQAMMQQARKLQKELEKTTTEIDNTTFKYENDNVLVEGLGSNRITKIEIKNDDILEDGEMLADVLTVAVNNVLDQVKKEKERKLSKYGSGLGGLF